MNTYTLTGRGKLATVACCWPVVLASHCITLNRMTITSKGGVKSGLGSSTPEEVIIPLSYDEIKLPKAARHS